MEQSTEYSSHEELPDAIRMELWSRVSGPGSRHKWYGLGRLAPHMEHGSLFNVPSSSDKASSSQAMLPPHVVALIEKMSQELEARKQEVQELHDRLERQAVEHRAFQDSVDRRFAAMSTTTPRHTIQSQPTAVEDGSDESEKSYSEEEEEEEVVEECHD